MTSVASPHRPPATPRAWHRGIRPFLAVLTLAGVVGWIGSDRRPSDATAPLLIRGQPTTPVAAPDRIRLGTFNMHGGRGPSGEVDLDATAGVFQSNHFDLIGLYEVHGSFTTDQAGALGDRLDMASVFAGTEQRWWHDHFGNGLLIGRPVREVVRIALPGTQTKRFRNALLTTFDAGETTVRVLTVHIDTQVDRERQLSVVFELFRSLKPPAVLMGDLNCRVDHPSLAALLSEPDVVDAVSSKLGRETSKHRIDHLLVRGLEVRDAGFVRTDASDHPCLWAELNVPASP